MPNVSNLGKLSNVKYQFSINFTIFALAFLGNSQFFRPFSKSYRDVAQLVAHYVRDVGVGRSSRLIPTTQGCQTQELALQPLKTS